MITGRFATLALLALTLVLGLYGIERSLWLDEAWVANSVNAPTLGGMFYYPNWLQTSPPLFLLLARAAIRVFGLSTVVLRSVPLLISLVAVWAMLGTSRRLVSAPLAVLATAVLAFHPTVVEYFRSFKQYGGEVAATCLVLWAAVAYLQKPGRKQFYVLLGVTVMAMTLSYPTVFLLPGLILVVALGDRRRAIELAVISGAVLAALYWFLVRPNLSPALRTYWATEGRETLNAVLLCIMASLAVATLLSLKERGWRQHTEILCMAPYILLTASKVVGWYPDSPRTSLFIRPCFLLFFAMFVPEIGESIAARILQRWRWLSLDTVAILLTAVVMFMGVRKQIHEGRFQPEEDMSGAVRFLRMNVGASDLVLVHPSLQEGFLLYTAMQGWTARAVIYGDTGWPCCPRGRAPGLDISTPEKIRSDLDARIPRDFHGRIWLFYTNRPLHWDYVRVEDSKLWQNYFWSRDCRPELYIRFANLGLTPMICGSNSP